MNNKGQTLVLFIALLPFILIIFVLVFDLSYISAEKSKLEGLADSSIKSLIIDGHSYDEVKSTILKNNSDIRVTYENETLCHYKKVPVIFGGVINKENYDIKTCKGIDKWKGE